MFRMKRKLWTIFLIAALVLSLASCGGGGGSSQPGAASSQPDRSQSSASQSDSAVSTSSSSQGNGSERFEFLSGTTAISIDQDMADVLAALGEAQSYFEAASCAFDGLDKTYTYPGFVITTRPEDTGDFVNSILLTDDSVTTAEGIYIGSTKDDVIAAYGESSGTEGVMNYTRGNTTLNIILKDGVVASIEYIPA